MFTTPSRNFPRMIFEITPAGDERSSLKVTKLGKRIFTVLLAGLLTASLTACGSSSSSSSSSGSSSTDSSTASEESSSAESSSTSASDGEVTKLVVWGYGDANTDDCNAVAEAVSEITREEIGVEIELVRGQDGEQVNLALTSGEQIDLLNYNPVDGALTSLVRNNYATALDDLLEEYGSDILTVVNEEDLEACKIGGILYTLPNMKDNRRQAGFAMRTDILEELGIDVTGVDTYDEVHDILVQVHEAYPDMYPLVPTWSGGGMQTTMTYDPLGDSLGVLEDCFSDSTEVVNLYATDTYREFCEMMYQWNQEGLIMPDATTTTENNLLSGNGFAMFENIKPGKEVEDEKNNNCDIPLVTLVDTYSYTDVVQTNNFIIPYCSENPEKAMELWEMMYTNSEVSNLFVNGIEGEHWDYTDDSETFISTPEGVDSNASGYHSYGWAWPNQQITPVWEGDDADLWDQLQEFNNGGTLSPAFGFTWDSSSMLNEVTACNNVVSQYDTALRWGTLNPDETLDQFNAELEAAGINEIIEEKQRQLDEYLASKE